MAVRQYIGARYVPRFSTINGGVWDNTYSYEALEIVKYGNDYYTSRKPVPTGIAITNTEYWVLTGNYNGAIGALDERVEALSDDIHDIEDIVAPFDGSNPVIISNTTGEMSDDILYNIREYESPDITFIKSVNKALHTKTPLTKDHIVIGQFNIGSISERANGSYGMLLSAMASNYIANFDCDICGMQEVYKSPYIPLIDAFGNELYTNIAFNKESETYGYYKFEYGDSILSDALLSGATGNTITVNNSKLHWTRTTTNIDGIDVAIYSAHMSYTDTQNDYIDAFNSFFNVVTSDAIAHRIVCLDTNIFISSTRTSAYQPFRLAGYKFCNDGQFRTFPTAGSTSDGAIDEIIVSGNINITTVEMKETALFLPISNFDHNVLIATIKLV